MTALLLGAARDGDGRVTVRGATLTGGGDWA